MSAKIALFGDICIVLITCDERKTSIGITLSYFIITILVVIFDFRCTFCANFSYDWL